MLRMEAPCRSSDSMETFMNGDQAIRLLCSSVLSLKSSPASTGLLWFWMQGRVWD